MACFDKYGVEFSDDRKKLVKCPVDFKGDYIIPNSVGYIDAHAFADCNGLTSIDIPNSVTSIGEWAFSDCTSIVSITIPENVTRIGHSAFSGCAGLTRIIVENGNTKYDSRNNCNAIIETDSDTLVLGCKQTIIPNNIISIGSGAFYGCSGLKSLIIPKSITSIGSFAFSCCFGLDSIEIPQNVKSIGKYAFEGCSNLKEIYIPVGPKVRYAQMEGLENIAHLLVDYPSCKMANTSSKYLFFDTETTGKRINLPVGEIYCRPRLVQLAWLLVDADGNTLKQKSAIIWPDGFDIPQSATEIHHITTERAKQEGLPLEEVLKEFMQDFEDAECLVAHNIEYDRHIIESELFRSDMPYKSFMRKRTICTMLSSTDYCALPNTYFGGYKWPSLQEMYQKLFNRSFEDAHDALADITATKDCFFELKRRGII